MVVSYIQHEYADVTVRILEAVVQRFSVTKVFLEISKNSQENTRVRIPFLIKLQVFSCEFCELFKNIGHLSSFWYSFFIMLFLFVCSFFPFVIIFSDWFLLGKNYFDATTLSKVTNN